MAADSLLTYELPTIQKYTITIYKIIINNLPLTSQNKQNDI